MTKYYEEHVSLTELAIAHDRKSGGIEYKMVAFKSKYSISKDGRINTFNHTDKFT